jgi:hypothetical protein
LKRTFKRFFSFFETESHYVDQAGLEFSILSLQNAGYTGLYHHVHPRELSNAAVCLDFFIKTCQ